MSNANGTGSSKSIPLFPLGQVVATPGALDALDRSAVNAADLLQRHQHGDWGNVPPEDAAENELSGHRRHPHLDHHRSRSDRHDIAAPRRILMRIRTTINEQDSDNNHYRYLEIRICISTHRIGEKTWKRKQTIIKHRSEFYSR